MLLDINIQFKIVIFAILSGIIIGFLFDIYREFRGVCKNKILITIEDILFWILSGIILIYAIFISFILLSTLICNKKLTINKYHLPGIIYCLIISFMLCKAISLITVNSLNLIAKSLVIIGATLFVISDYLLSLFLLNKNCPKFISRLNLITYYLGQILIALSILYIA